MVRKLLLSMLMVMGAGVLSVSAQEDLATELRFGHFAADAPNVDVFMNGELLFEDRAPSRLSSFEEIDPGIIDIVIAETGRGINRPLVKLNNLDVQDGHGYSITLVGQANDNSLRGLVIDETEAMGDCDLSRNVFRITVNNIQGAPPISVYEGGQFIERNIEYGDYAAVCVEPFFADTARAVAGEDLDDPLFVFDSEEDGNGDFWEPYMVYLWGLMGEYPGTADEDYYFGGGNWYTLAPDPITFIEAYSGWGLTYDSEVFLEFDRVAQAFRDTGLDEVIAEEGPFTIFFPTDQALEALPAKTLNRLLNNPDAMREALMYHMVQGTYYDSDLFEAGSLVTLQGTELEFVFENEDDNFFYVNGVARVEDFEYPILDGSTVYFINDLNFLLPN